jgi:hypothetical protein
MTAPTPRPLARTEVAKPDEDRPEFLVPHVGMTPAWFDRALHRAMMSGKTARRLAPGQWVTSSVTVPGLLYLTTPRECSCPGHRAYGKCGCRALVCFLEWEREQQETPRDAA